MLARHNENRKAASLVVIVVTLVTLALVAFGIAWFAFFAPENNSRTEIEPLLAKAKLGEFVSQVLDQGEVQSSENVELRCQVRARNGDVSVLEVVEEGRIVTAGEILVRLDSTSFEKELEQQKVSVANAKTEVIQADAAYAAAVASLKEYDQGIFVEELKLIENEIFDARTDMETANQEIKQAKAVLEHSKRLQNKGFITDQQLEADTFSLKRAELTLEKALNSQSLAEKKKWVLENITKEKELNTLRADIKAAKVKLDNQIEAEKVETGKLDEIQLQINNCTVRAPEGVQGQVVLAKERGRGTDWVFEEGASVRENQVMIRLPNPEKMEVKALVNEQSITRIRENMLVKVNVDALSSQSLNGVVTKVNQYAEASHWSSTSVRKYAVIVKILDPPDALKPGMNASCSIQVEYQRDVVIAPIQTVYASGNMQYCLVKNGDQWETRSVDVADDNSQIVWIRSGIEPGEELVMNPGAYTDFMDLPDVDLQEKVELSDADQKKLDGSDAKDSTQRPGAPSDSTTKPAAKPPVAGGPPSGGGRPPIDQIITRSMERYDSNRNGKIDKDEMGQVGERVKKADSNGDGSITKAELKQSMMKRFQQGGGGGGGSRPGGNL